MGTRKKWKSEEKLAVIMDGLRGRSVKEICQEYGISEAQYYKWRDQGITLMKKGFEDKRQAQNTSAEADRNRLLKIIGEQQLIIDLQKKTFVDR
jgi:transposase